MKNKIITLEDNEGVIYKIELLDIFIYKEKYYAVGINSNNNSIILNVHNSEDGITYNMLLDREAETTQEVLKIFNTRNKDGLSNQNLINIDKLPDPSNFDDSIAQEYKRNKRNSNTLDNTIKKYLIVGTFLSVIIIGSVSAVMFFNYQNEVLTQNSKKEQIKLQQDFEKKQADEKQAKIDSNRVLLNLAIEQAKKNRQALWDVNADKNGLVDNDTVKWIDERYNQEVKIAIEKYK